LLMSVFVLVARCPCQQMPARWQVADGTGDFALPVVCCGRCRRFAIAIAIANLSICWAVGLGLGPICSYVESRLMPSFVCCKSPLRSRRAGRQQPAGTSTRHVALARSQRPVSRFSTVQPRVSLACVQSRNNLYAPVTRLSVMQHQCRQRHQL